MVARNYVPAIGAATPSVRNGDTPVHSPIKDIALSSFTEVVPLARGRERTCNLFELVVEVLVDARATMRQAHRQLPFGNEWR